MKQRSQYMETGLFDNLIQENFSEIRRKKPLKLQFEVTYHISGISDKNIQIYRYKYRYEYMDISM